MQFTALFDNEFMNVHMWIIPSCWKYPYSGCAGYTPEGQVVKIEVEVLIF